MSSRKERKEFDGLTSRIILILLGATLIALSCYLIIDADTPNDILAILGWLLGVAGSAIIISSLLLNDASVEKFSESTGSHEILIVYFLLSVMVTWLIRRFTRRT